MEESYPEGSYSEPEPRARLAGWQIALIVAAALIVVCCLCLMVVFVLTPVLLGPEFGNVFSTVIETLEATTPMP